MCRSNQKTRNAELPWAHALKSDSLAAWHGQLPETKDIVAFCRPLESWYRKFGRDFQWRKQSVSIYEVVVTECLLQRTRAEKVSEILPLFLSRFTDWKDVERASTVELERALKPLGIYRRRASSLKALAKRVIGSGGRLPRADEQLHKYPGIGQYVLYAIQLYRYNECYPLLDSSMARLLERYFGPRFLADIRFDPYLQQLSRRVVKRAFGCRRKALNWAMLDYAAMVCTIRNPQCESCDLSSTCAYYS